MNDEKQVEIKKCDGSASPFRSNCWAVLNKKGYVIAYCFEQEVAISLKLILNMQNYA